MKINLKTMGPYLTCIGVCSLVEVLSGLITRGSVNTWYNNIIKPDFTPPKWVFAPVWTVLYLMMGCAWGKINDSNADRISLNRANLLFITQLTFNFLWSVIYFGYYKIGLALIDIILLISSLLFTIIAFFKISNIAGWLLIPYLLWTLYAAMLNAFIWLLNS